ncbi:hypothetical protein Tco_0443922, partial [Tanacetum coccineum]
MVTAMNTVNFLKVDEVYARLPFFGNSTKLKYRLYGKSFHDIDLHIKG